MLKILYGKELKEVKNTILNFVCNEYRKSFLNEKLFISFFLVFKREFKLL